jgi:hypothetical protein
MQIILPQGIGWAAMPLMDDEWGQIGLVAKRCFDPAGNAVAGDLRLADEAVTYQDSANKTRVRINAEADIALFKEQVDVHLRGVGNQVDAASITFNGLAVMAYAGVAANPASDPANLFGYEPREDRIGATSTTQFDFAAMTPEVFHSSRRSGGYTPTLPAMPLPGSVAIKATSRVGTVTRTHADLTLTLKSLTLRVWLYEGGPDRADYWCAHATVPMLADTVTLTPAGAEVLWRGAVSLAKNPLALIRKFDITEGV